MSEKAATGPTAVPVEIQLPIAGMTCASCVNRIERFLGKTPGVTEAMVNLATEAATIRYLPDLADRADLVGAIEAAGYELKPSATRADDAAPRTLVDEAERRRRRATRSDRPVAGLDRQARHVPVHLHRRRPRRGRNGRDPRRRLTRRLGRLRRRERAP